LGKLAYFEGRHSVAHHTGLKRDDALKVLPDAFVSDPERLARFRREAQVLASLNHPNIAHVYGLEQSDGVQALVLEMVEGPTIADRIAQGPIPVDEALPIAKQIADALEAAHEQGIIHRDLKPANIKLRPDGTVKVLDFGLAKAMDHTSGISPPGSDPNAPTLTRAATEAGMILGTAAYMAPEQARGKAVDRRADIWAFGVVLFEMLTGTQVFRGDTISDTLAAVLTRQLDWHALPSATPEPVRQLVRRCLERDVRKRLQSIGEARIVLEDPAALRSDVPAARPTRPRTLQLAAAVAGAVALFAAGWLLRPAPAAGSQAGFCYRVWGFQPGSLPGHGSRRFATDLCRARPASRASARSPRINRSP
jgi:serine/threonine-protein kinase